MAPKVRSRQINKSKFLKPQKSKNTVCNKERIKHITDETSKAVIPVGPHFQADIPDWSDDHISKNYPDESKWVESVVWKPSYAPRTTVEEEGNTTGKGRPDSCSCTLSGSTECVRFHVRIKHNQLKLDLGPAYYKWRFHELGEAFRKSWDFDEPKHIRTLATTCNMKSKHPSFLDLVLVHLPSKCRKNVVRYYFNVYVPSRISAKITSGALEVDSDED